MRQVFLSKSGAIQVEEAPAPGCGAGEVLIDVAWSVISTGTETAPVADRDLRSRFETALRLARLGAAAAAQRAGSQETLRKARVREGIAAPTGYSVAGVVRELGSDVADLRPATARGGRRVRVRASRRAASPCRATSWCRCRQAYRLRAASFATVGAIALQGVRRAAPQVGETAVVIGLGLRRPARGRRSSRAAGCRVIGVDPRADRVELAAERTRRARRRLRRAAAELEARDARARPAASAPTSCCSAPARRAASRSNLALRVVRQRGRVVVVGAVGMELEREPTSTARRSSSRSPAPTAPAATTRATRKAGSTTRSASCAGPRTATWQAFLELAARGGVDPERLVAAEHPLEEAPAAFAAAKAGADARVALVLRYPAPRADAAARSVTSGGARRASRPARSASP